MANRYNDQDYPHYNERNDRYNSRSERDYDSEYNRARRGARQNALPENQRGKREEGYYGTSSNRDFGRGYGSEDRDYDDSMNSSRPARGYISGFDRNADSDRGDYMLYGYNRENAYGSSESERSDRDSNRNYNSGRAEYDRQDYGRNRRDFDRENRGSSNERQSFERRGEGFYEQGGGYVGSERGFISNQENRSERGRDERGWWDKTSDEISSWFGDGDAARRRERDQRGSGQGQFRGRGPKNYRRSDDRIKEDINDRLTDYPYLDASDIEVEVSGGEATLTGAVDTRYAKRMAEDIAENVSGVTHVENRLRVRGQNLSGEMRPDSQQDRLYGSATTQATSNLVGGTSSAGETGASTGASMNAGMNDFGINSSTGGNALSASAGSSGDAASNADMIDGSSISSGARSESSDFSSRGIDRLSEESK